MFGSVGTDLTDAWDVTLELRHPEDDIENENPFIVPPRATVGRKFDSWSPRLTSTYKLTADSMVYVDVARGNKPGVIDADPRFPPGIRLADEDSAWSYELGTKNSLGDGRITANAAIHYIDWSKQQLTTAFTFPTGGTQSYITNAGKSEVRGLGLELQAARRASSAGISPTPARNTTMCSTSRTPARRNCRTWAPAWSGTRGG